MIQWCFSPVRQDLSLTDQFAVCGKLLNNSVSYHHVQSYHEQSGIDQGLSKMYSMCDPRI